MPIEPSKSRREFLLGLIAAAGLSGAGRMAEAAARPKPANRKPALKVRDKPADASKAPAKSPELARLDVGTLRAEQFDRLKGQGFQLAGPNGTVPLVLSEITDLGRSNDEDRSRDARTKPFLLIFDATNFDRLPAKVYTLTNSKLGSFDAYLNEVRADDDPSTVQYAVVFN